MLKSICLDSGEVKLSPNTADVIKHHRNMVSNAIENSTLLAAEDNRDYQKITVAMVDAVQAAKELALALEEVGL